MNAQQPREVAIPRSHRPRSSLRLALLAVSLTALAPITAGATFVEGPSAQAPVAMTTAQPATPGYLTIQFGRAMWTVANGCTAVPGALTLAQIAQDLQARSITATGTVVVDRVDSGTNRYCQGDDLYANWTDLASLNTTYGWQFVSDGLTHGDMTKMTPAQQQQESCGSLPPLEKSRLQLRVGPLRIRRQPLHQPDSDQRRQHLLRVRPHLSRRGQHASQHEGAVVPEHELDHGR